MCFAPDYVIVGSDSGRIVILEYNPAKNQLERVHMETFGKSGCRRIVPGQYLAIDPKGRAVMIGECCGRPAGCPGHSQLLLRQIPAPPPRPGLFPQ